MNTNNHPTPSSGPNSTTPNAGGPPAPIRRRRPTQNPFITKKPPPKVAPAQKPASSGNMQNGVPRPPGRQPAQQPAQQPPNGMNQAAQATAAPKAEAGTYTDYPIYITKSMIEEGMRYHGLKFNIKPDEKGHVPTVDPYDPNHFTRPVRLHRRYARDKPEQAEQSDAPPGTDDKERELFNERRAARQAEREANQALIAPTGNVSKTQSKKKNQKNVEDVYYDENNPKQQKAAQLRYEETKPWHLEDDDNKNTWIGSYQEPLSEGSVLLTVSSEGFSMTPVERWYKFIPTNRLQTMKTAEEAEKIMQAKVAPSRWFMNTQVGRQEAKETEAKVKRERTVALKRAEAAEDNGYAATQDQGEFYNADRDDLDFEFNDEFQDDDEGMIFGDEADEAKEIEKRIREEMRGANISAPGLKNTDADYDREEEEKKAEAREQRKREKRMRKQLIKKERKYEFEDDSDDNPYTSSSEDEDSEEERERLETERKEEEETKAALAANGGKSGASTKGTNTPSGRTEKRSDPSRPTNAASLKRPGSPNLSDASGNESSRKKAKVGSRPMSSALANGSRPGSPIAPRNYASGSETETTRPPRDPKLRLKQSPPGSPTSRPQSPAPPSLPTLEEVRAAIPNEGIAIGALVQLFKRRVGGAENTTAFIKLVKAAGRQNPATKKIMRNEAA